MEEEDRAKLLDEYRQARRDLRRCERRGYPITLLMCKRMIVEKLRQDLGRADDSPG
jgi:hypothetical protein